MSLATLELGCETPATMGVRRGVKRTFAPLEIGTRKHKYLKNLKSAV